jgi:hypothetical protein
VQQDIAFLSVEHIPKSQRGQKSLQSLQEQHPSLSLLRALLPLTFLDTRTSVSPKWTPLMMSETGSVPKMREVAR